MKEKKTPFEKNEEVIVTIEDLGENGEGIGKCDGYTLFINGATIGDTVRAGVMKAKKSYGYARVIEVLEPSPYRVDPVCPVAGPCGGCQLQHLSYEEQLRFKQNRVDSLIRRIGKIDDFEMLPIIGMDEPWHYRNKAQFPIGKDKDGNVRIGFYAKRTHSIIECKHCHIQNPINDGIIKVLRDWIEKYRISVYDEVTGKGLLRHMLSRIGVSTGQCQVCLVINGDDIPHKEELIQELSQVEGVVGICLNINKKNTNVILGDTMKTIWGNPYIEDYIGDVKFRISPMSFYQVNPVQTKNIYDLAKEFAALTGEERLFDMYCGIGTIGLYMAKGAKELYGVEIIPEAIEDAKANALLNGIENAHFTAGKAEDLVASDVEDHFDVVVVDPPRKGCDEKLLETLKVMAPERIVYVSCNPATLARDLNFLTNNGYVLKKVRCVDAFPQSVHVESVVLLSRS